jgi:hypothetical protein
VEWKYLLFKWNDSDDEIRHAAKLANELDVHLRFCLTHSPNRSNRFTDLDSLRLALTRLAPRSDVDNTFQLREEDELADAGWVISDSTWKLLSSAVEAIQRNEHAAAIEQVERALQYDPSGSISPLFNSSDQLVARWFPEVLSKAKFASTQLGFAAVCHELGYVRHSRRLTCRALGRRRFYRDQFVAFINGADAMMRKVFLWTRIKVRLRTRMRKLSNRLRGQKMKTLQRRQF